MLGHLTTQASTPREPPTRISGAIYDLLKVLLVDLTGHDFPTVSFRKKLKAVIIDVLCIWHDNASSVKLEDDASGEERGFRHAAADA